MNTLLPHSQSENPATWTQASQRRSWEQTGKPTGRNTEKNLKPTRFISRSVHLRINRAQLTVVSSYDLLWGCYQHPGLALFAYTQECY